MKLQFNRLSKKDRLPTIAHFLRSDTIDDRQIGIGLDERAIKLLKKEGAISLPIEEHGIKYTVVIVYRSTGAELNKVITDVLEIKPKQRTLRDV